MDEALYIFESVHYTLLAEEVLKNYGLDFLMVPVPPWVNEGCGLGIRLKNEKRQEACYLLEKAGLPILKVVDMI